MNPVVADEPATPHVKVHERAFPRRAAKGTVLCRTGKFGMGRAIKGKLLDISPDGAGLMVTSAIEFGARMELELHGIGCARPLVVPAEVRYVATDDAGNQRIGVRFDKRLSYGELADFVR